MKDEDGHGGVEKEVEGFERCAGPSDCVMRSYLRL